VTKGWTWGLVSLVGVVCGANCTGDGGGDGGGNSGSANAGGPSDGSGGEGNGTDSGGTTSQAGSSSGGGNEADGGADAGGAGGSGGGSGGEGSGGLGGGDSGECGWTYIAGGTLEDSAWGVVALEDQSVVIAGTTSSSNHPFGDGGTGAFALRLTASGEVLWSEVYPGVFGHVALAHGHAGRLVIAGTAQSVEACDDHHGARDAWVAEISPSSGELLGSACIGGDDDEEVEGVVARGSGAGAHYLVTGTVDSHESGNIGPKHGGGGFDSPDVLLGFWTPGSDSAIGHCFGSDSPNYGHGFLGRDAVLSSASIDSGGDFEGLDGFGGGDVALISLISDEACTALPCASVSLLGGSGDDAPAVGIGNIITGDTTSTDGAIGCPDADTMNSIWIARYEEGDVVDHSCLSTLDNVVASNLGLGAGTVALVGMVAGMSGDFENAEFVGSPSSGSEAYLATYDESDLAEPLDLAVVGDNTYLRGATVREDGCVVAVGTRAVGTSGNVFVYTRPLSP